LREDAEAVDAAGGAEDAEEDAEEDTAEDTEALKRTLKP